jgi:hypothetical protein
MVEKELRRRRKGWWRRRCSIKRTEWRRKIWSRRRTDGVESGGVRGGQCGEGGGWRLRRIRTGSEERGEFEGGQTRKRRVREEEKKEECRRLRSNRVVSIRILTY